jgi:hypothetical protein
MYVYICPLGWFGHPFLLLSGNRTTPKAELSPMAKMDVAGYPHFFLIISIFLFTLRVLYLFFKIGAYDKWHFVIGLT